MFVCGMCKKVTEPKEKATKLVTQTRPKTYHNSGITSHGVEIVEEILVCPRCVPNPQALNF